MDQPDHSTSDIDNFEGVFYFDETPIIAAMDRLLATRPALPLLPELAPCASNSRPEVSVDARLLRDGVVSLCLPSFKQDTTGRSGPLNRRLNRDAVPHCILVISPAGVRLRNQVRKVAAEIELPLATASAALPRAGIAMEVPYHVLAGLYGRRGHGDEHGIVKLSFDPAGTLYVADGTARLAITVRPLPGPPPPLSCEALEAEIRPFNPAGYSKALARLAPIARDGLRRYPDAKFWLEDGRVLSAGHAQPAEYLSESLGGLNVCLSDRQLPILRSLLARLRGKHCTSRCHQNLTLLSNGFMTVMFGGCGDAPPFTTEHIDHVIGASKLLQVHRPELLRTLLITSIVANERYALKDAAVHIALTEGSLVISARAHGGRHSARCRLLGMATKNGMPALSVKNAHLLDGVAAASEDELDLRIGERGVVIIEDGDGYRVRHGIAAFAAARADRFDKLDTT